MSAISKVLGLALALALLAGCASATTPEYPSFLPPSAGPSPRANLIYSYLKMEQAMRKDDKEALLSAAQVLIKDGPASRPLADAAGWLLGNRQTEDARRLLDAAVKALPDDLPLHMMLAETMMETEETDKAIDMMRAFHLRHPDASDANLELALLYLKAEQPEQALKILDGLPGDAKNPTVLYYQAQALRTMGDLPGTAAKLREALKEAPDFLEAMLELALVEEQLERFGEAREIFEKLLTYDPGNQDILLRLMTIAMREGNPDKAFEIASRAQDSYSFTLAASSMFMNEGRFDLAETLLDKLAQNPETPGEVVFYQAAAAYEGEKDVERTMDLLAEIGPESRYYDRAFKLRAQIMFENNRLEDALRITREARETFPDDREFKLAELELLITMGRRPEAMAMMEKMLAQAPGDNDLAFRYAYLHEVAGDRPRAMALMEELLKRDPDEYRAMNFIGYTLAEENRDLQRSRKLLTRAVELSPESDYIVDSLAWIEYRLGNFKDAWDHIRLAIELSGHAPTDPTMWDHYGDIASALGLKDEARHGWEKALELEPADPAPIRAKLEKL